MSETVIGVSDCGSFNTNALFFRVGDRYWYASTGLLPEGFVFGAASETPSQSIAKLEAIGAKEIDPVEGAKRWNGLTSYTRVDA